MRLEAKLFWICAIVVALVVSGCSVGDPLPLYEYADVGGGGDADGGGEDADVSGGGGDDADVGGGGDADGGGEDGSEEDEDILEQECTPGEEEEESCGSCGHKVRVCDSEGVWGEFGTCQVGGICEPGETETEDCGNCGTKTRRCSDSCEWEEFGRCEQEGVCSPGEEEQESCGQVCGTRSKVCTAQCEWDNPGECQDTDERCHGSRPYCRNDYCWGWTYEYTGGAASREGDEVCVDFGHDHKVGSGVVGEIKVYVEGRPGARWNQVNQHRSCIGYPSRVDEQHLIGASGKSDDGGFGMGPTQCSDVRDMLGRWESWITVQDTDGSWLELPRYDVVYHHKDCGLEARSCASARTYCGP